MLKKEAYTDFVSSVALYIFRFNLLTFKCFNCTREQCSPNNVTKYYTQFLLQNQNLLH